MNWLKQHRLHICLFLTLLICYEYFLPRWADPSQNSRLDMVVAVVEDGTFRIDDYVDNTVDYAKVGDHYYSDKPPGAAFLGIPVYAVVKLFFDLPIMGGVMDWLSANEALKATLRAEGTGLLEEKLRFAAAQVTVTLVASAIPTALIAVVMYSLLARFTSRPWYRLSVVLGYGLLTPAFAYAGAFYGHQLSAACLFGAFYLMSVGARPRSTLSLLIVGFLLGYGVISDYPSALVAGILFLYAWHRLADRRRVVWVVLSGVLVAAGWMAYNRVVFGSPWELGYSHSELWSEQHQTGFMSLTWPHWRALWGITFSPFRGLFLLSPLLLLSVPGFVLWYRCTEYRSEFWVSLASVSAMFLFNASSIMWWGGFAIGPRYVLSALPFLALPTIFVFREWWHRAWMRALAIILFAWSWGATWGLTLAEQAFPPDTLHNPLVEYAWPNWQEGNIARNLGMFLHLRGLSSLAPLLVAVAGILVAAWIFSRSHPSVPPKTENPL